ncbi:ankyrin-3-like [Neocloeon triangulifer]|uniref:ankyrin-3-like n=1 Tax=Neocloeon triangulifer TaxID=2078957 RepID=UPI00286F765C|nr:ankyrin-3-like [Neocloeon triangulifer]XP_059478211.1 ankyrin-3-like [Neocloeon triangulifer]XP_059478212.1 ankyrin-3-like [Neocloeon triangulifer]XP_059478213.1 ankyrin-3-like [Neocloeon triangulifer]XP_059478214.1 ankyrin-3-like [Neocloeon triangulifer]XP_059478215.1 ankyrin-3-like [Neocloeon triangulifer]XP_059478216.1 ankyrin-3-like [Neocloeon triangulifer]XP_059478217.1 ankyrin-3-like [Neocloeon triangulifer]XP_059478218.1 ankyrin-3-like [Neocloeon triangulifer]
MEEYFTKDTFENIIAYLRINNAEVFSFGTASDVTKIAILTAIGLFFFYLLKKFESLLNREYAESFVYKVKNESQLLNEVHICSTLPHERQNLNRCVSLIMEAPNVINVPREPYGFTPFLNACWSGCTPLVRFMLANGANINRKTKNGDSPLYLAVRSLLDAGDQSCDLNLLGILLAAGCDVDEANYNGMTALHLASSAGNSAIVKWLLDHDADTKLKTSNGETALKLARGRGHQDVVGMFPSPLAAI